MARLYPFRALRYNSDRVDMTSVVTQPYDKITPAMQERYYAASPYNLIRIILGKHQPGDSDADNVYTRAAATLNDWRAEGILKEEPDPAIYGYSQTYKVPGTDDVAERRGFIALGHLYDYADQVVYRHEQTFPKHKSDRLALFKATRAYCEQIYMLYSDPTFTAEHLLFDTADGQPRKPDLEIADEYGVIHRLWKQADPGLIQRVLEIMADKKLIIADGHHRYETSTTYMQERAAELGLDTRTLNTADTSSRAEVCEAELAAAHPRAGAPRLDSETPDRAAALPSPEFPEAAMMMTFVNMDAAGITILPTHRVVFGLDNGNGRDFAAKAAEFFTVSEIATVPGSHASGASALLRQLDATPGVAFVAATRDGAFLLVPRQDAIAPLLAGLSPRQQQLDVTQLHKVVLEHLLGLTEETIRSGQHIRYVRDAEEALQQLGSGSADLALLIKPVTLDQIKEVALHLDVMPQKSTDFYPKLLSGLAMYTLD